MAIKFYRNDSDFEKDKYLPRKISVIAVLTTSLFLSGCAAPLQGLRNQDGNPLPFPIEKASVGYWLEETQALNAAYMVRYENNVNWQPLLDIPIIGLAIAGVGSLLFGASTSLTAGLGLGAGGATALRAYTNPGGAANAYLAGVAVTDCMIAQAIPLRQKVGDDGKLLPKELNNFAIELNEKRIVNARWLAAIPPDGSEKQGFVDAQAALKSADDSAAAILAAFQDEQNAASTAAVVLAATLGRVKAAVARAVQLQAPTVGQVQSDVVTIVEQAVAQRQRLNAVDLIAGPAEEPDGPAAAVPTSDSAEIRAQAARTTAQAYQLGSSLPRLPAVNAAVTNCQAI